MIRETERDRNTEEGARKKIEEQLWSDSGQVTKENFFSLQKTSQFEHFDWMIMRGDTCVGWAEYKRMYKPASFFKRTGELWVYLKKLTEGRQLQQISGRPWFFFAELDDVMVFHPLQTHSTYRTLFLDRSEKEKREYKAACAAIPTKELFSWSTHRHVFWDFINNADKTQTDPR